MSDRRYSRRKRSHAARPRSALGSSPSESMRSPRAAWHIEPALDQRWRAPGRARRGGAVRIGLRLPRRLVTVARGTDVTDVKSASMM